MATINTGEVGLSVLEIDGVDYSQYIARRGIGWARNDIDSDSAGRTLDTTMHRGKLGTKRTLSYTLVEMTRADAAALDDALSSETFYATYMDLHGSMTKEFYCSSFSATLDMYDTDTGFGYWVDASFTMIEV